MKNNIVKENLLITISIIGCALALLALCILYAAIEPKHLSMPSLEVGVLGAITTVLIGWQLFTIFNLQRTVKEINKRVNDRIDEAVKSCQIPLEGEIAYIRADKWRTAAHKEKDSCSFELAFHYYIEALECFIKYPKAYYHEEILNYIKEIIEVGDIESWLTEEDKNKGCEIISQTDASIKNEVIGLLMSINTDRPSLANIELYVMPKEGNEKEHKIIFHNTGELSAYSLRIGFPRKSDGDSVSLRCENINQFDEIEGDGRLIVYVTPKETFNDILTVRVWYKLSNKSSTSSTYFSREINFRNAAKSKTVTVNEKLKNKDVCTYPSKIKSEFL